jgi:predicted amidohydrolase YtcJ
MGPFVAEGGSMELIVEDAVFVTMAASAGPAGCMLVRDGRIAAVGSAGEIRAVAAPGARVVRLGGATVIPGLIDGHCHVSDVSHPHPTSRRFRCACGKPPAGRRRAPG